MIGSLMLAALCVTACAAQSPTAAHGATNLCGAVGKELWVTVDGVARPIVLEWSGETERAAAALLAAALRRAGYGSTRLRHDDRPLYNRAYATYNNTELVVVLGSRWLPGDIWGGNGWLEAISPNVIPITPRLHTRCPPHSATTHCGNPSTLYVVDEWKHQINLPQFTESSFVNRRELLKRVRAQDDAVFAFVDVEVWSEQPGVAVYGEPLVATRALAVADGAFVRYAHRIWKLFSEFAPSKHDLLHMLTLEEHAGRPRPDSVDEVCEWALSTPLVERLDHWAAVVNSSGYKKIVVVFLCTGPENDTLNEYRYLLELLKQQEFKKKKEFIVFENCNDYVKLFSSSTQSILFYDMIGVVGPGRILSEVSSLAKAKKLALMSYTAGAGETVGAIAGRYGTLAQSIREVLAACRWNRLAVLSEQERVAREVSAALRATDDLNLKDLSVAYDRTAIRDALNLLDASEARIFLVNGGARFAAEVVSVAAELELTAAAEGRVWFAREWVGGTVASASPYEVTLSWRGGRSVTHEPSPLHDQLAAHWEQRGAWPLYAAPLVDALFALVNGYNSTIQTHRMCNDDVHSSECVRAYWHVMETGVKSVSGVVQELHFKNRELKSPRIFVYRWKDTRAELFGEWRLGASGMTCPVLNSQPTDDGTVTCFVHVGDRFERRCHDIWYIVGAVALIVFVPLLLVACVAVRRAVRARDDHLVKRAEEMLEARWRAKASRLEPYFVERCALNLREQIGAGRFGRVWLGILNDGSTTGAAVAAKALREDAAPVEETEFFREARSLAALQHEHVVRFVGVCVTDGPPLLLMEYALFGDLLRYLRARRHLAASDSPEAAQISAEALTRFARQAAAALAYLAHRGYVHRDLRAANCLVDERRQLKLADFGMARATTPAEGAGEAKCEREYTSRRRALFPVLWMAPESLSRGVFSAASDVWSLGVLCLELVTLGARPYGSLSPLRVHQYVVGEDGRPPTPRELNEEAHALLEACWRRAPGERPAAGALASWLADKPHALAPARAPADDRLEDVDSGIGEPPRSSTTNANLHAPTFCYDDVTPYEDDASVT